MGKACFTFHGSSAPRKWLSKWRRNSAAVSECWFSSSKRRSPPPNVLQLTEQLERAARKSSGGAEGYAADGTFTYNSKPSEGASGFTRTILLKL